MNTIEKYCKHCKKAGHVHEECWLLHGRPGKEQVHQAKQNKGPQKGNYKAMDPKKRNPNPTQNSDEEDEAKQRTCSDRKYSEEEKQRILYEYHDAPLGGHQGVERTINRIRLTHNWRGITKDVEEYIAKCELCQKKIN